MSIIEPRTVFRVLALLLAAGSLSVACSPADDNDEQVADDVRVAGDTVEVREWHTDNGLRVLFVEAPEVPLVEARLTFAAGSARDGDLPGTARLVAQSLLSGSEDHDVNELAEAFESHGAEVSTDAARDMAWIRLRSLSDPEHLEPVAETLAGVLSRPAFPEDEVDRLVSRARTGLLEESQSPGGIAGRLFWEALYGDHPYASNPIGTGESLDAIGPDELRAFHSRYYVAANGVLVLVGDLDRERAGRLADTLAGGLPEGEPADELPPPPEIGDDIEIREPFPSIQAHVLIGRPAVTRGQEDWPALYIANRVFGGASFTSRLFREVREERGLVYGVYSVFRPMGAPGPFQIGLQTRGDQEEEARRVVADELARMNVDGPDTDETTQSVRNVVGGFPLRIDSNANLASYLAMIGFYDLPLDYLDRLPAAVAEVDAAAAHAAWRAAVGERPLVTVIVGGDRARGNAQEAE